VFDVVPLGGSELCRVDRPSVYAKIRNAVIIGNPKSGDIIRLFTQTFALSVYDCVTLSPTAERLGLLM